MILAEDEVGISDDHKEIMVLSNGAPPGEPLAEHLPIADEVLELEITPNRPDCLAIYGVAREVHAITGQPLAPDPTDADAQPSGSDSADDYVAVVAQAAADRGWAAPDQQRRRHHQLRDAPDRSAAALV